MEIRREEVRVGGFDGATLAATLVMRGDRLARATPHDEPAPLVLLPGHLRSARSLEGLAERLLARPDGPVRIALIDYRGRGASAPRKDASLYTPRAEAQDVVSVLDALGWHHIDIVGSARGGLVAFCLAAIRPALVRRLVLGDIGPELDGVGLARLKTHAARTDRPNDWAAAVAALRMRFEGRFPALEERDFEAIARSTYRDADSALEPIVHDSVLKHYAAIDADERYPTLWPEFRALRRRPILLLRAEHSDMLNDAIVERMRREHGELTVHDVDGQGHAPVLDRDGLPERIAAFLADDERS